MKTILKATSCIVLLILTLNEVAYAQAPFGIPPGGNNQAPTPDKFISTSLATTYVAASPVNGASSTYIGTNGSFCTSNFNNIDRTGSDIQVIKGTSYVAEAITWDGGCPAFSLTISDNPFSQFPLRAAFVVELNANNFGSVSDPDIIISQNAVASDEIAIIIVYEYSTDTHNPIAYEQWNYNHFTNTISYVPLPNNPMNISLSSVGTLLNGSSPNIDANESNQYAVVFEMNGRPHSYIGTIGNPTVMNFMNIIDFSPCQSTGVTPDVTISDQDSFPSIVSYVLESSSVLYVIQEDFNMLSITNQLSCSKKTTLSTPYVNPRIASPPANHTTHTYECAVVAENPSTTYEEIRLFYNMHTGVFQSFSVNDNPGGANLIIGCINDFPAIAYGDDHIVSVAWTYTDNCGPNINTNMPWNGNGGPGSGLPGVGTSEVISVSYFLHGIGNTTRVPADPDYYMLVNSGFAGNQKAASLMGATELYSIQGYDSHDIFYAFSSDSPDVRYKISDVSSQPQIRKKSVVSISEEYSIIEFYPNPASDQLVLDLSSIESDSKVSVSIIGINGQEVFHLNGVKVDINPIIDLKSFNKGIYILEYNVDGANYREKLLIQ